MPSAAAADLSAGSKRYNDIDLTFTNCRFEEREKTSGGKSPVAVFVSDVELLDGHNEEMTWEVAPVEFFNDRDTGNPRCFVDEGKLLDADGEKPYGISNTSDFGMLSNSLERAGISTSVMQRVCAEPELLNGVKIHAVQEVVPGRSFVAKKGAKKGQTVEWTALVAEEGGLIEDPNADGKNRKAKPAAAGRPAAAGKPAGKPAPAAAGAARRPAAKPEPEETVDESAEEISELDAAAIDVVLTVLSDPKANGVKTYSPRQNDGGVTLNQMATAAMTTYKGKNPSKNDVVAALRDAGWAAEHATDADGTGLWEFEKKRGLYFAVASE